MTDQVQLISQQYNCNKQGNQKSIKSKIFSFFWSVWNEQTEFHAHTTREFQVIRSRKVKIYRWVNFSCSIAYFFLLIFYWNYNRYWYAFASLVAIS